MRDSGFSILEICPFSDFGFYSFSGFYPLPRTSNMTSKRKPSKKRGPNAIIATEQPGEDEATVLGRTVLRPTVQAAVTLREYDKSYGDLDLKGLIVALTEQTEASNNGDLRRAEAMLTTQAHTLDAIFNSLATRAIKAEYLNQFEQYLKLGLRAQSQCRATWEALSAIKNPPVAGYVHQANIAHTQQVNNGTTDDTPRTRENQNSQNELLEQKDERMDTGTTSTAGKADTAMATLGEIDGAEDAGR
jgi:hypothetical protein